MKGLCCLCRVREYYERFMLHVPGERTPPAMAEIIIKHIVKVGRCNHDIILYAEMGARPACTRFSILPSRSAFQKFSRSKVCAPAFKILLRVRVPQQKMFYIPKRAHTVLVNFTRPLLVLADKQRGVTV